MNLPMKFSMMAIGLLVCGLAILFSGKVTVSGQSSSNSSVPPLCAAFESEAPAQTPTVIPEPDVALEHWKSKSKFFFLLLP